MGNIKPLRHITFLLVLAFKLCLVLSVPSINSNFTNSNVDNIQVNCANSEMVLTITIGDSQNENLESDEDNSLTKSSFFNGLVYPRGLSRNSPCMTEFIQQSDPIIYRLPLRSCNTMSTELDDGRVEYFNTIVVQPHLKLVTNQGKAFQVRCKYQTYDETISINKNEVGDPQALISPMELPRLNMKIYHGDSQNNIIAENVKIGDPLTLVVTLQKQDEYGIQVTDCLVRDGLGWSEQKLINNEGCPIDGEIMGNFIYNDDKTRGEVHFQAHKFPYTQSVYYQCNIKLCTKQNGGCEQITPPSCSKSRGRRQTKDDGVPATIELYTGLYVNEINDLAKTEELDDVTSKRSMDGNICISQRHFAYAVCIAGFLLMLCVAIALICLVTRRSSRKSVSAPDSSIYSGPYTNTAYSHSS